jgi:hypothetical protein
MNGVLLLVAWAALIAAWGGLKFPWHPDRRRARRARRGA